MAAGILLASAGVVWLILREYGFVLGGPAERDDAQRSSHDAPHR
jgi:hypothetical protein